ncbi:MAG: transposase family protein [Clostridiaceae bacterium]|jgi:hypothetical protein|nr:transposase family protein [Clostridiaceae bacterium]
MHNISLICRKCGEKRIDTNFIDYFTVIFDPRQEGKIQHKLLDVPFIAVAATICRCDEWGEMEEWACAKEDWLRQYLELPNAIPSWFTIARVLDVVDPMQFENALYSGCRKLHNSKKVM